MRISKYIIALFCALILCSCEDDSKTEYKKAGFVEVKSLGAFHFILVDEEFWGDRAAQMQYGRNLCAKNKLFKDYCEVYYFADADDVPKSFPIVNRKNHLGLFQIKNGKVKIKTLPKADDYDNKIIVFIKNIYRKYINKNIPNKKTYIESE